MISLYKFPDAFDEYAKNEAACVQALRHLISKADSEIDDLKDELAIVQCRRKWTEADEYPNLFEVCCAAFKQRVDSLTSIIQRLRNGMDTISDIQRPSEKICDIIDALIRNNFTELDEQSQEGDLDIEKEQAVSCGSPKLYASLESSMESEKQTPVPVKLDKPTQTLFEESCLNDAMTEVISADFPDVKVFEPIENVKHASKEKTAFSTNIEPITSQSPFQASDDEGNTKPTGPQCKEVECCMGGSKTGKIKSSILVAETEVMVKVEQDDDDTNIEITYSRKKSDHDINIQRYSAVEGNLMALENQSESVSDLEITYARKKSDHDSNIKHDSTVEGSSPMALQNQSPSTSDLEITYGRKKSDHDTNIQSDSPVEGSLRARENQSQSISDLEITYGRKKSNRDTNIEHDSAIEACLMPPVNQSKSFSDLEITYGRKKYDGDTIIQHDSTVEGHLMALENQSQSIPDLEISYGRKRPSVNTILKPPGNKVRMKILDDVKTINPSPALIPKKTITKRKYSPIKSSVSSGVDGSFRFLPETNWHRKLETEENIGLEIPLQVSQAKRRQPKGTKVEFPDILSSEVTAPEGSPDTKLTMMPNSSRIIVLAKSSNPKSSSPVEVKKTVRSFDDTLILRKNNPIVVNTKEKQEFDLESLKERRTETNFLTNMTALQLRKIAKLLELRGVSKLKKDQLIEELSKSLATL